MTKRLIAALACRNSGARLYGKPLQNLDVESNYCILDNIVACLRSVDCIDDIVLGISEGIENKVFEDYAYDRGLEYIVGDETDVLMRLIQCGKHSAASDIFRVTSESPFVNFEMIDIAWSSYYSSSFDALFLDDAVDGCGFEIISMAALEKSHSKGDSKHRSEMCTLYMREHLSEFKILKLAPPKNLIRKDLRLTVDNPEDLVICRKIYANFKGLAPNIPVRSIIEFLDENPNLVELTLPFTEEGYSTMYL